MAAERAASARVASIGVRTRPARFQHRIVLAEDHPVAVAVALAVASDALERCGR